MVAFIRKALRISHQPGPRDPRGDEAFRGLAVIACAAVILIGVGRFAEMSQSAPAGQTDATRDTRVVLPVLTAKAARSTSALNARTTDVLSSSALHLVKPPPEQGVNESGDNQVAILGTRLSRPLVVRALDDRQRPVQGARVYYQVIDGEEQTAGVSGPGRKPMATPPSPLVTDADGYAVLENVWVDSIGLYKISFYTNPYNPAAGSRLFYTFEGRSQSWFNWMVVGLAGGLALFLLGAKLTGEGLGRLAGPKLRDAMSRIDNHPVGGVGAGAAMTFLTQSSTASTTMFVSFAGANTLKFRQALPLIYGSAIGTTITVQLLAFNIYKFALIAVAAGVVIQLAAKQRTRLVAIGQGVLGFGLIFYGMHIMIQSVDPLRRLPWLSQALYAIKDYPGWALVIAMFFTATVHSSAAVLGLVLALSRQDLITPLGAVPLIFGANIGTTATALMASVGLSREARRVAIAHLVFKVIGVLIFLPFMGSLAGVGVWVTTIFRHHSGALTGGEVARSVANIHSIFNVIIAIIALPCSGYLEALVLRFVPRKGEEIEGKLKYLDLPVLTSPTLVFGAALREISRMARHVEEQMKAGHDALFGKSESKLDDIHRRDDKVDNLQRNITRYLTDMMRQSESNEDMDRFLGLIQIVNDIENIGDILDKNIAPLARKMILNGLEFSPEAEQELKDLYLRVGSDLSILFVALSTGDRETSRSVRSHRAPMAEFSQKLLIKLMSRLQVGKVGNLDTSSILMDLINYLQRVEFHIYRIAGISAGDVTYHADDAAR